MDSVIAKAIQTSRMHPAFLERTHEVCVMAVARDGTVRYCNPAMSACLELSPESVANRPIEDFLTEFDARLFRQQTKTGAAAGPLPLNFVNAAQHPQTLICMLETGEDLTLVMGERSRPREDALNAELLRLNNDLTTLTREHIRGARELEKALAELKEMQAMLFHEGKMAALGKMAAGVAHEVNNPVAFVISNHATLQSDCEGLMALAERVRASLDELAQRCPELHDALRSGIEGLDLEYLKHSLPRRLAANREGLERVQATVQNLLAFSRVDRDGLKPCEVAGLMADALLFLSPMLHERRVEVDLQIDQSPKLECNPGAMSQALGNVIANAIQASPPGARVTVSALGEGGKCIIEVADRGGGIEPEYLDRIFDPFFTAKPVGSGTGLGLSITERIIKAHHGSIRAFSRHGEGTRIRIELPLTATPDGGGKTE